MTNPVMALPSAMTAIKHFHKAMAESGAPESLLELIALRASQINGCAACVYGHDHYLRTKHGETNERIAAVAVWREAPFFTDGERAVLALTEVVTRLADRSEESVSDELWAEVNKHYDEKQVAAIVLSVGMINFFNRVNTTVKEPAGQLW
ncbi:carboxymuconolactone decarboxylase family protein [Herbihabitans rhizosphaerae]|nr:carboxymuconolactone decarboxylase family protein [Herbihabitans rhizosphaerae]